MTITRIPTPVHPVRLVRAARADIAAARSQQPVTDTLNALTVAAEELRRTVEQLTGDEHVEYAVFSFSRTAGRHVLDPVQDLPTALSTLGWLRKKVDLSALIYVRTVARTTTPWRLYTPSPEAIQ